MQRYLLCFLALATWAGCAHTPQRDAGADFPPGTPTAGEIFAQLTGKDRLVANFSALGTIRMQLPGQAARQRFTRSRIAYLRPGHFEASAMKATQVVRIYVDGDTFLLEHQAEKVFYFGHEGDHFDDIALEVAPSTVFREFFVADALAAAPSVPIELLHYSEADHRATLGVFSKGRRPRLERQLLVEQGPEGWRTIQNDRLGDDGMPVTSTRYTDYTTVDGVLMPRLVETSIPQSEGLLSFQIQSNARANRATPEPLEDIAAVRERLLQAGLREVTGYRMSGKNP